MVVHGAGQQQRGDRRHLGGGLAVRQDDEGGAPLDGLIDLGANLFQAFPQRPLAAADPEQSRDLDRGEALTGPGAPDVGDLSELVGGEHREGDDELAGVLGLVGQKVRLGPDRRRQGRDELLAIRVQRRVGDLGEQLSEVVEDEPGP